MINVTGDCEARGRRLEVSVNCGSGRTVLVHLSAESEQMNLNCSTNEVRAKLLTCDYEFRNRPYILYIITLWIPQSDTVHKLSLTMAAPVPPVVLLI